MSPPREHTPQCASLISSLLDVQQRRHQLGNASSRAKPLRTFPGAHVQFNFTMDGLNVSPTLTPANVSIPAFTPITVAKRGRRGSEQTPTALVSAETSFHSKVHMCGSASQQLDAPLDEDVRGEDETAVHNFCFCPRSCPRC